MASGQTEHYSLNQWQPEDKVLREEFNQDNAKLDTALEKMATQEDVALKAELVTGSYTGNGAATRTISLGFRPRAVFLCRNDGTTFDNTRTGSNLLCGGLVLDDMPLILYGKTGVSIVENGFQVTLNDQSSDKLYSNAADTVYHYLALR